MRGKLSPDADIDLGLAISAMSMNYGQTRSQSDLAAFCGCRKSNIQHIERRGLQKLRKAIFLRKDPEMLELLESLHLK